MAPDFATISADAHLAEAYEAIKRNLEGPPHSPALVVLGNDGKYAVVWHVSFCVSLTGLSMQPGR